MILALTAACEDVADPISSDSAENRLRTMNPELIVATGGQSKPRFIVTVADRHDPQTVAAAYNVQAEQIYTRVLNGFAGEISDVVRAGMLKDARIVSITRDTEVRHQQSGGYQWGAPWSLDRIDQRSAVLDGLYRSEHTGAGVTVYIVDSGIRYSHLDFEARASYGYDVYGADGSDCYGHGTHVAATVGGRTFGVAKDVRLVSVKVLGCTGSGSVSLIIAGLEWVAAHATGPSVVNMSIAAPVYDLMDRTVQSLTRAGITVVVAAANYNADACSYSPAREPSAITVGASNQLDGRASFSNWGSCVDVFAPGYSVLSADFSSDLGSTFKSGTSMAAPHVAGAAALYLQQNPDATSAQVHDAIKAAATQGIVTSANSPNNHLLFAGPAIEPPPPATGAIELTGSAVKRKTSKTINLSWKGAQGSALSVKLNGNALGTAPNSGNYSYQTSGKARTTFQFEICELEGQQRCSNKWSVTL
jgi:serine protease